MAELVVTDDVVYRNPLASPADIEGFAMEGDGAVTFPQGRMRMENLRDPEEGQAANIVHWCPEALPDDVAISWGFWPIRDPGLAILFFSATGRGGEDVLDPALQERVGVYGQYHHGDINALHVSYFRRKHPQERAFTTCNLRKSFGFHLVAQGADPIPAVADCVPPYRVQVIKSGPDVAFSINELELFRWTDDGESTGAVLAGGKIGFRQMAPLIAEYSDLVVRRVERRG